MTIRIGVRDMELNHRVDLQFHELIMTLEIEIYPDDADGDYTRFMDRVSAAMGGREPNALLLALLESATGHTYRRVEEPDPNEPAPRMASGTRILGGRNIDLGG